MIDTAPNPADAADIIGRIMAEMEEVFGLINRPHRRATRNEAAVQPELLEDPLRLAA